MSPPVRSLAPVGLALAALLLVALALAVGGPGAPARAEGPVEDPRRSLAWLRAQIVPNELVPTPEPRRRGLILSYAPAGGRPGPLHRKAFVYDAALAAIAFGTSGDWLTASRVLQALSRVQRDDGSFWFAYSVDVAWPAEADHDMAIVRAGATAWAGYAFAFALERGPGADSPRAQRERTLFLGVARRVADALLGLRVTDGAAVPGLVRGGRARVRLVAERDAPGVTEVYEDRPIHWVSTEHNLASYFLLAALDRLTGEPRYGTAAREIRARLLGSLWQEDLGQFAQGVLEDGRLDRRLALDCASWGALFLLAAGERERAARAAATADRLYRSLHGEVAGHRPYHGQPIYDDPEVQRRLLPEAAGARWEDWPFVWSEGSLGVALAQLRLGGAARARQIVAEVLKLRQGDGIRLGSRELPYEFATFPSVAATAWHVIVAEALRAPQAPGLWSR